MRVYLDFVVDDEPTDVEVNVLKRRVAEWAKDFGFSVTEEGISVAVGGKVAVQQEG